MDSSTTENKASIGSVNGSAHPVEVAKEAKEKKDRSSWVKTIGMRTLRLRRSTDSRSSRLSIPSFSSLDRPGKNKKNKSNKPDDIEAPEAVELKPDSINSNKSSKPEHVKVQTKVVSAASSVSGSTSISNNKDTIIPPTSDRKPSGENLDKQDPARFLGEGLTFKGKLIGVLEVSGPRGDRICQEALSELKMAVKAAGEHKQKITIHIALDGLRIRDEKTGDCLYHHQVHKISFIAQDLTDTRAFGYIFGSPDTGHRFFGIKTEKSASQVVIAMRDLFQVVFDLKKKEIERAKQQLEMQQKFLATRAAETAPPSKNEPKFSIAETYIEGACALGASSSMVPNRSAPEVDLLNLEVELTSLQEGLDSIHHNLADSGPFRGSTASISSDPMNPMPKRSSISSTNTNNTTPIPASFNVAGDPFGDSFDPYFGSGTRTASFNMGSNGAKLGGHQIAASCDNSALTSPFSTDPFAQVDPFPGPKFPGDSEFFNADPFDSPSGPFSFTFPNDSQSANERKTSEGRLHSNTSLNSSPAPTVQQNSFTAVPHGPDNATNAMRTGGGWTASFEDNFVPESGATHCPASGFSAVDAKPGRDRFTELDPLGSGRSRPFIDRKDFFHELKNPPKKVLNEHISSDAVPSSSAISLSTSTTVKLRQSSAASGDIQRVQVLDVKSIPNSFSTNFDPPNRGTDFNSHFKPRTHYSHDVRAESPPNYSPPPPPRANSAVTNTEFHPSNPRGGHHIIPPPASSPSNSRLLSKKSSEILKQLTISESNSNPKTLPRTSVGRLGKQFTVDVSLKDEVPNLSPPPRPPHNHVSTTPVSAKTGSSASAVPRPMSSGSGPDRLRKISETGSLSGLPPEPPPRPLQTTTISTQAMHLVSPPPPLPPKKQSLSSTFSSPLTMKQPLSNDIRSLAGTNSNRSSLSEANDLPLPLPLRKTHGNSEHPSLSSLQGGRYAVPLASSLSGSPSLSRRDNESIRSTSSIDSMASNPSMIKLTMEQALAQVATLSLGDLARKLELPVDKLAQLTFQQLAEKLTDMDLERKKHTRKDMKSSKQNHDRFDLKLGFDDDFSASSTPPNVSVQKESSYDRYAVFRELAVEDASGFSIVDNCSNMLPCNSDDEDLSTSRTLDKRDSSSERTLQADITGGSNHITASFTTGIANTMDDVTDVNLSDDQDNGKFPLDDEDDLSSGFMNKPEWATFESNFDDPFATTALVKAEDGNESPWDSDEGEKGGLRLEVTADIKKDNFDFKPFVKPAEPPQNKEDLDRKKDDRVIEKEKKQMNDYDASPELLKSPPGRFQRQSSGSSRHSERSSGGGPGPGRGGSDFSDSGRPNNNGSVRPRKGSKDYDRYEIDRDRDGSGRYKERDRERDHIRSDSRNSYSSMSRKHRNGDSEDDYVPSSSSIRGNKGRLGSGRRDRDYERGEIELEPLEDEEDDRSYASHHSNYSSGHPRRHKRYPPKHYIHSGRRRSDKAASPDRCSNRESDDDSFEDEHGAYPRKRERDYYVRDREYYERHHRPIRPSSSGGVNGKRHIRDSPRHPDLYYRRGERPRRHRDEDDFNDSRELTDYSGEDEYRGGPGYRHSHGGHRRIRGKRSSYRDKDPRDSRGGHYYTNSPSFDSDSGPEGEKEVNSKSENKQRRPTSAKHEDSRRYSRGSPELSRQYDGTRASASGSARRYQSELSLNSKTGESQKLSSFTFEDDFGASSLPPEPSNSRQTSDQFSSPSAGDPGKSSRGHDNEKVSTSSDVNEFVSCNSELPLENKNSDSHSPFENDFVSQGQPGQPELQNGLQTGGVWDNKDNTSVDSRVKDNRVQNNHTEQVVEKVESQSQHLNEQSRAEGRLIETVEEEVGIGNASDIFPPTNDPKAFNFSGRRLESIKSEEEKSNDDSHSHSASESAIHMKKSDSYNIFKQRVDDPFADDDFFA